MHVCQRLCMSLDIIVTLLQHIGCMECVVRVAYFDFLYNLTF